MQIAISSGHAERRQDATTRVVYAVLLPLFVVSEGVQRLHERWTADEEAPAPTPRGPWLSDARSHASIATSYALMARSMLQSSGRRARPGRLS